MGYNISDVGGETANGVDVWDATLDLSLSNATTVSGDFDVVSLFSGASLGEATDGYSFSALSNPTLGTLDFNETTGTYTFTVDWGAVLATGSDQVVSFTVTGTSGGNSDTDTVVVNLLICVTRGTLIQTTKGSVPVEDLSTGDLVETLDGAPEPVRWIGSRKLSAAELIFDESKRPVVFEPGSLGADLPERDLSVSPQHRMFLQGWQAQLLFGEDQVLVPAKSLVNGSSIRKAEVTGDVEYFHLLFDAHQIIFTEGAPTESFHPGAYTLSELDGAVRDELFELFPELRSDDGYGKTACIALRPWEAALLTHAMELQA
ncbi:Hint domain-containing protein [Tropicibacter sp. R16_0]|uniref:Hint domain-containing protein n=1 Tax=Tropicibacter sp. R16_0 TaxID=2821102 RepID=UPI001ADCC810|nr:Hint domain-containing protein [Tropicibacter sp. R16_0]MBO9452402.1 Hint domain-containing protein [Tropicibacter sp. R16_0]